MLLAPAGRECVRAMAAFLTNDSAAQVRGRPGHYRGARSVDAGPPANKRSGATGHGRVDGPEHWAMAAAIRNRQDGPCATFVARLYLQRR